MSEEDGLLWAYRIDASGRGTPVGFDVLDGESGGYLWIHIDFGRPPAERWLREESGLGELEVDALVADETRPRATPMGEDGLLLILRGVNLNPGADPEDMVSLRVFASARRVITMRRRRLLAVADMREAVEAARGAPSAGAFIAELADRLVGRMVGVLQDLDEALGDLDDPDADAEPGKRRRGLHELRREAILLRRYLSPQRDALSRLVSERLPWLDDEDRLQLREVLDRTTRYVEDLEAARERAAVAQDELSSRLAEQMNERMYVLSVIAGIFLPLGFLTGLLGVNVGGIPGTEAPWAFWAVTAGLGVFGVGAVWLFRRLRWL